MARPMPVPCESQPSAAGSGVEYLSPDFTLAELLHSDKAVARGIANVAQAGDVRRLRELCQKVLQPIRDQFGPIHVESGFRSVEVNRLVNGAVGSAHRYGCAADIWSVDRVHSCEAIWRFVIAEMKRGMPVDQVIWERDGKAEWIHVGMCKPGRVAPRQMAFKNWR